MLARAFRNAMTAEGPNGLRSTPAYRYRQLRSRYADSAFGDDMDVDDEFDKASVSRCGTSGAVVRGVAIAVFCLLAIMAIVYWFLVTMVYSNNDPQNVLPTKLWAQFTWFIGDSQQFDKHYKIGYFFPAILTAVSVLATLNAFWANGSVSCDKKAQSAEIPDNYYNHLEAPMIAVMQILLYWVTFSIVGLVDMTTLVFGVTLIVLSTWFKHNALYQRHYGDKMAEGLQGLIAAANLPDRSTIQANIDQKEGELQVTKKKGARRVLLEQLEELSQTLEAISLKEKYTTGNGTAIRGSKSHNSIIMVNFCLGLLAHIIVWMPLLWAFQVGWVDDYKAQRAVPILLIIVEFGYLVFQFITILLSLGYCCTDVVVPYSTYHVTTLVYLFLANFLVVLPGFLALRDWDSWPGSA